MTGWNYADGVVDRLEYEDNDVATDGGVHSLGEQVAMDEAATTGDDYMTIDTDADDSDDEPTFHYYGERCYIRGCEVTEETSHRGDEYLEWHPIIQYEDDDVTITASPVGLSADGGLAVIMDYLKDNNMLPEDFQE